MGNVVILATLDTKRAQAQYLSDKLAQRGVSAGLIDLSLSMSGTVLAHDAKGDAMQQSAARALSESIEAIRNGARLVIGVGGGTGGEVILNVLKGLPITFPKMLISTLPFDPRAALADSAITLVPTLVDISGLNAVLRSIFDNAAWMAAGLCTAPVDISSPLTSPSIAITGLGVTDQAVRRLVGALDDEGRESTVFHANGYGGAAFARFAQQDAFDAIIDLTPHEITRIHLAGVHVPMPARFTAGGALPRVVLPGGINFIGLGAQAELSPTLRDRAHYAHTGLFTHVKVSSNEMAQVSAALARNLNALPGPVAVIVPMGGFSHQDCPHGAIEDAELRQVCLGALTANLNPSIPVIPIDAHICDPLTTDTILETLNTLTSQKELT